MEPPKGFVSEREEFNTLRDGVRGISIFFCGHCKPYPRLGLKRLCPQSNKFREFLVPPLKRQKPDNSQDSHFVCDQK